MNTANAVTIAALAALTPTVTCLIGIILARQDLRDMRTEMRSEISGLRGEMVTFRNRIHADLVLILERVAVVESRQNN